MSSSVHKIFIHVSRAVQLESEEAQEGRNKDCIKFR